MGQAGCWLAAGRESRPRSLVRLRFVPEARKKLAGGEAQRNHRNNRTEKRCAPAGRENRETSPSRRATPTFHQWPAVRPGGNPVGVRRRRRREREWYRCVFTTLAPRRGAFPGWGGGSGGSAALHHRLISYVPPARRRREAGRAGKCRKKMSKLQAQHFSAGSASVSNQVPSGTEEIVRGLTSFVPNGTFRFLAAHPALKCWAIFGRPRGTEPTRTDRCKKLRCARQSLSRVGWRWASARRSRASSLRGEWPARCWKSASNSRASWGLGGN